MLSPPSQRQAIIDKRLKPKTRSGYRRKIKALRSWLVEEGHEEYVEGEDLSSPLPDDIVLDYLAYQTTGHSTDDGGEDVVPAASTYMTFSHISGHKSAIMDYYRSRNWFLSDESKNKMSQFMAGCKRQIAELKEGGEMPMQEGKAPMSSKGYYFLGEKSLKHTEDMGLGVFAHCFLTLCWNLMARSVSVSHILYDHVSWEEDALVINLGKTKGDQEGKNAFGRHLYANPRSPSICPILALAIFVFCQGHRVNCAASGRLLFAGNSADRTANRFGQWLRNITVAFEEDIMSLGIIIKDIGTHSFRKGIATILSNCPGGPTAISIWLRAGWSLGNVQDRYIYQGAGGDQYVGRAATLLDLNSVDFAILPPHFVDQMHPAVSLEEWEDILPGYSTFFPVEFRVVIPYLLSSLVFHKEWLSQELPMNHPLFLQRVWTCGILEKLKDAVVTGHFLNTDSKVRATGVPPFVAINHRVNQLECKIECLQHELLRRMEEIPKAAREEILAHCQVNGAVPLSGPEVMNLLRDMHERTIRDILAILDSRSDMSASVANSYGDASATSRLSSSNDSRSRYLTWTWGDRIHPVPEGFVFPTCNVRTLWDLWWDGEKERRIAPYRFLKSYDVEKKSRLSKGRCVMEYIIRKCERATPYSIVRMNLQSRDEVFTLGFEKLCSVCYPSDYADGLEALDSRRVGDITYIRFYELLTQIDSSRSVRQRILSA